ncbi:hypothetical protein ACFU0X_20420 [Streptomyces cellulosae]|uniref:Uncharacterized protein n=1 Tax=Streptomyces cellulosae TaxID=1968 RepID=A0ABW6JJ14_STRCE
MADPRTAVHRCTACSQPVPLTPGTDTARGAALHARAAGHDVMPLVPPRRALTCTERAFLTASASLLTGLTLWAVFAVRHALVLALVIASAAVCACSNRITAQPWKGRGRHRAQP